MLQSLVITLREGVEAALVIGIILAYLRKTGRRGSNRIVYMALTAAIISSLIGAVIVDRLQVSEEVYEGWLLLVGAGFVFSMVWWMWRTGSRLKGEIEGRMEKIAQKEKVEAEDADVEKEIENLATASKQTVVSVRSRLTTEGGLDRIKSRIRIEKALDFVFHNARKGDSRLDEKEFRTG